MKRHGHTLVWTFTQSVRVTPCRISKIILETISPFLLKAYLICHHRDTVVKEQYSRISHNINDTGVIYYLKILSINAREQKKKFKKGEKHTCLKVLH